MTILPFGLIGGLFRFYPEYKKDIKALTGTILSFLLIVAVLYCLILFLLKNIIISSVFNNQTSFELYYINVLIVIGSMLFSFSMSILRCEFKNYFSCAFINKHFTTCYSWIYICLLWKDGVIGFLGFNYGINHKYLGFYNWKKLSLNWNRIIFKHFLTILFIY